MALDRDKVASVRVSRAGWAGAGLLGVVVGIMTVATRIHELPLDAFAASAAKVSAGQVWLLPASAIVVDKPQYIGLAAFALIGAVALRTCGTTAFWIAAVVGHIGSTLAVYAIIGGSRVSDSDAFANAYARSDFGVSAMQGAWVGAVAATAWLRAGSEPRTRAIVAAGVAMLGGLAWWLHPDPSILTTEHLFAFVLGCVVITGPVWAAAPRLADPYRFLSRLSRSLRYTSSGTTTIATGMTIHHGTPWDAPAASTQASSQGVGPDRRGVSAL